jgi:DNA replication licensing factor MCM5
MVPVGELPRHMMMHAERYLTGKVVPGSRIIVTGIYSTFAPSGKGVSYFTPLSSKAISS